MHKLTNKEEEIMQILWKLEKAFVKDVLAEIKENAFFLTSKEFISEVYPNNSSL